MTRPLPAAARPRSPAAALATLLALTTLAALLLHGRPAGAGEGELAPPAPELRGVWRLLESSLSETATGDAWVEIGPTHWAAAEGGRLQYRFPILGQSGDELVVSAFGNRQRRSLAVKGDELVVTFAQTQTRFNPEPEIVTERYRRSSERPEELSVTPVPLGAREEALSPERIAAISAELARRAELDQEVREIFATAGAQPGPDDLERMRAVDRGNTDYLLGLLAEIGWIDDETFGEEAAENAWLIVQHTEDLRLKWTVLQELERRFEETGEADGRFALLWDRTRIWLGHEQRYGSQIFYGPEGMFVPPLENPERVDELREAVGLEPLAEYLERFRERNEGQPVPVRDAY